MLTRIVLLVCLLALPVVAFADTATTIATDAPAVSEPSALDQLADVKAKYAALKSAQPGEKLLAIAALLAVGLKLLLSLLTRYAPSGKAWAKWVALGLAVPIALLSHYALGHGWFAALLVAGSGPGAIVVHELLKRPEPKAAVS